MAQQGMPDHHFSPAPLPPQQQPYPAYYSSTPPAPPPKPPGTSTPSRGPPLPPPPQSEPSELDGGSVYQQGHPYHQQQHQQPPQQPHIPPVEPGWLPSNLKDKTVPDLQTLLQDQALQAALLSNPATTHPALSASEAALTPLLHANLQLSHSLLDLEGRLTTLRQQSQQRLLALRALEQQHRSKLNETENALNAFSPTALYQRLNASVQEQDSLVRGLEESWLEEGSGEATSGEIGEIVKRVREAKRVAFLRRERRARWDEGRVGGWR